jgi:LEA14-like dessication related protein
LGYSNVRLEKASLANSVVAADLKFFNPNSYALQLKQADIDVFVNDKLMGHSKIDSLLSLPGRDTSAIPFRVNVDARSMAKQLAGLLLNPDVRLRLKGTAKVGKGGFFMNMPVDYEATQRIDFFATDTTTVPAKQQ